MARNTEFGAQAVQPAPTILRRTQVEARTGLSRSSIYAKLRYDPARPGLYDPAFPKPISIGLRTRGWIESEVTAWLEAQIKASRTEAYEARDPGSLTDMARAACPESGVVAMRRGRGPARVQRQERRS